MGVNRLIRPEQKSQAEKGRQEMANCIAKATGIDKSRDKYTHRLGSIGAQVQAATWKTYATAYISKDGSGYVQVIRDGETIHEFHFPAENTQG